jgi:hypothetical protein
MLGGTHYLDDMKARFGIQLPVIAAICAIAEFIAAYEPAFRVLRPG